MALNPQQLAAVKHTDTPLLVLAGAGSGKTGVITEKIAYLIEQKQYSPRSIIAVTFTNKAAQEMKARLTKKLGASVVRQLSVSTFHRLGLNILRESPEPAGLRKNFTILDQSDALTILKELIREQNSPLEERTAQSMISNWKSAFIGPEKALKFADSDQATSAALLFRDYEQWLRSCNSVDFDDLINLPVVVLSENAEMREKWQGRVRHLLVDEYQDTNESQYALMRLLMDKFGALTVVGDDDQSIYSWRGARPDGLITLKDDYPNLRVIKLEQNYRSSQRILKAANAVISHNPHLFEKKLWSDLGIGDEICISVCRHGLDEADWVAGQILMRQYQKQCAFSDFAILYRSNFQSRHFEKALREKNIPYQITGGSSFFDKAEVKDMLAYLKLLVNPDDDTAFIRVVNTPRREIGPNTMMKLGDYARTRQTSLFAACHEMGLESVLSGKPLARVQGFANWLTVQGDNAQRGDPMAVVNEVFDAIHFRDWLETSADTPKAAEKMLASMDELLEWMQRLMVDEEQKDRSLNEVVNRLCLHDMLSRQEDGKPLNAVNMLTLHAAKGLEFPQVYMVGMEEDLMPHKNSLEDEAIEEERRLAYVGMTRARHRLTLTRCRTRQRYGESSLTEPSRFLADLPPEDVITIGDTGTNNEERDRQAGQDALASLKELLK